MKNKFLNFLSFLVGAAIAFGGAKMLWNLQDYTYVTYEKHDFCIDPARPAVLVFEKNSTSPPKNFREKFTWHEAVYVFSPEEEREISEILQKNFYKSFWWRNSNHGHRGLPRYFVLNLKIPLYDKFVGFARDGYPWANLPENDRQKLQEIVGKIIEKVYAGDVPAGTQKVFGNAIFDEFFGWKFENEIRGNADEIYGNTKNVSLAGTYFVVDFDLLNRVKTIQKFDGNAKIWEREYVYDDSLFKNYNFESLDAIRYADAEKSLIKTR